MIGIFVMWAFLICGGVIGFVGKTGLIAVSDDWNRNAAYLVAASLSMFAFGTLYMLVERATRPLNPRRD